MKKGALSQVNILKDSNTTEGGTNALQEQFPGLYGVLAGLMGTAPDEIQRGSVLDPRAVARDAAVRSGADVGFPIGTAAQVIPALAPALKWAGAAEKGNAAMEAYMRAIGAQPGVVPHGISNQARASEVTRANRRIGTTGQYVGAPPGVDSPQALGAAVNNYVKGMEEGLPGKDFYTNSSADIWARTGHDPVQSDLLAQNLATLSRANNVGGNTSMSAKAHIQAATGDPIKTGRFPSKDSPPLQDMYDAGQAEYLGHKRDPFATQLGVEWAPERIGRGVNDMHEAELMGYPSGKVGGATQHAYMDEIRQRAIDKANTASLGGVSDWGTGNAQAAAWTGNKIRRGDLKPGDAAKSYADYFPLHEANATYEMTPGRTWGHLQGLIDAPYDVRQAYHLDPAGRWNTSASGRDIGYTASNMLPGETAPGMGWFEGKANPANVARPVVGTETAADESRVLTSGSKRSLDAVEAARAYFDGQDAGAWHKVMPAKNADAYSGAGINIGRPMTEDEMKLVGPQFNALGHEIASAPDGMTAFTFGDGGKDFAAQVRDVLKKNKPLFGNTKPDLGSFDGGYIDYAGAGDHPGAKAKMLLQKLDAAPQTRDALDGSELYRQTVGARNTRDIDPKWGPYGSVSEGLMRARTIFEKEGVEGLRRAAEAGIVPAAFIGTPDDLLGGSGSPTPGLVSKEPAQ